MPLVLSHGKKSVSYISDPEVLLELLCHSDFDGEEWAVGDLIVFEDATQAQIIEAHDSHDWSEREPLDQDQFKNLLSRYNPLHFPSGVPELSKVFETYKSQVQSQKGGCLGLLVCICLLLVI